MPELPEVEVSRLGVAPFLEGQVIRNIIVRDRRLRYSCYPCLHVQDGEL